MSPTDTLREAVARAMCDPDRCVAINDPDRPRCNSTNCDTYIKTESALSAIEAAGWRIVPAEACEAQLLTQGKSRPDLARSDSMRAAAEALNNEVRRYAADVYREMVAAAPRLDATVRGEEG